jgi:cyclophilin family peptidyl-prolyl cis-trans isomerase
MAAANYPGALPAWPQAPPIATGRTDADYRDAARRYLYPSLHGGANPTVTIETDRGAITIELLPADAPLTVAAFLALVDRRYFDGDHWHRVVPNFVIQDGDPRDDGWGGPGFSLRDEISPRHYQKGSVGLALSGPDTGGSQYFITLGPEPRLEGTYPIFGRVTSDLSVLDNVTQGDRIRSVHR